MVDWKILEMRSSNEYLLGGKSVGMMTFPTGKIKNVPNHQSDMDTWSIEIDGLPSYKMDLSSSLC